MLSSVANLVNLCGEDVGRIPLGHFLVAELNIQCPVKSFAPYLGGRRGRVPSDSLRKFLQEVNLYNLFKHIFCLAIMFLTTNSFSAFAIPTRLSQRVHNLVVIICSSILLCSFSVISCTFSQSPSLKTFAHGSYTVYKFPSMTLSETLTILCMMRQADAVVLILSSDMA